MTIFDTNLKDEIANRQYQIIDNRTGVISDPNISLERIDTPTQKGSKVGANWFNNVGNYLNGLTDGTQIVKNATNAGNAPNGINIGSPEKPNKVIDLWQAEDRKIQIVAASSGLKIELKKADGTLIKNIIRSDLDGVSFVDNANDAVKMTDMGYGIYPPLSTNCLAIDRSGGQNGKIENISLSSYPDTVNSPVAGLIGTKVQFVRAENRATVLIYEIAPVSGRIWENTYTGTWSGWNQITETHTGLVFMNGWIGNGHGPILVKIGRVVCFNTSLRNGINTVGTVVANVPVGYRPQMAAISMVATSLAGNGLFSIGTDGNIKIASTVPDKSNVQLHAIWTVDAEDY